MGVALDTVREEPGDLKLLVEDVFSRKSEPIAEAMSYQFNPVRKSVNCQGLSFEVVLNHARHGYVQNTLKKLRHSQQTNDTQKVADENVKRSLQPHKPAPGDAGCSLCNLELSPLLIKHFQMGRKEYGLVVNKRPWGYHNFMLVTMDPEPQAMTLSELLASFELIKRLGPDYEGIFTGVGAGASVYHFHLQVHKGAAAIWRHLESGAVQLKQFFASKEVTAKVAEGWPARLFFFESANSERLARVAECMIETLGKGGNDFPYNIGFRSRGSAVQLILIPRSGIEQPPCIPGHPDSWGRFGFLELAGSIFVLTPAVYDAIVEASQRIYDAIAEMSIRESQQAKLIGDFRDSVRQQV